MKIKRFINIVIFIFIFALYFFTFLMIYDNFRERKLNSLEKSALELFENKIETKKDEIIPVTTGTAISATSGDAFLVMMSASITMTVRKPKNANIIFTSIILLFQTHVCSLRRIQEQNPCQLFHKACRWLIFNKFPVLFWSHVLFKAEIILKI